MATPPSFSPQSSSSCFQETSFVSVSPCDRFAVYFNLAPSLCPNAPPPTPSTNRPPSALPQVDRPVQLDHPAFPPKVIVFHHGAGYSGLSAACFAREIRSQSRSEVGFLAFDARGHGRSSVGLSEGSTPAPPDLSLSTLSADLVNLLKTIYPSKQHAPTFVLVGHSMGGAVVCEACPHIQDLVGNVSGIVVLDVVQGSAISALVSMMPLIASRPQTFSTESECIKYHVDSNTIRNLKSARISVPGILKPTYEQKCDDANDNEEVPRFAKGSWSQMQTLKEDDHNAEEAQETLLLDHEHDSTQITQQGQKQRMQQRQQVKTNDGSETTQEGHRKKGFTWVTDLALTQPYWEGWFKDLSKKFLSQKTARLLVLAGTDRLDKELTIGQMQGKYQLSVLQNVGHCIQEDDPVQLAEIVLRFVERNEWGGFFGGYGGTADGVRGAGLPHDMILARARLGLELGLGKKTLQPTLKAAGASATTAAGGTGGSDGAAGASASGGGTGEEEE